MKTVVKQSFSIREMEIGDLAEVFQLGQRCFKADLWPMLYRSWDEYEVTTHFNTDGQYCLVAENDSKEDPRILGFVLGTVVTKLGSAWSYGYIIWLCSHPDWGRSGVAGKLLDKIVEIMIEEEGIRIIMADTDPENERAVNFFRKRGFTQEKSHVYLSSNLDHNEHYRHLLIASRKPNSQESTKKKLKKKDKHSKKNKKKIKKR